MISTYRDYVLDDEPLELDLATITRVLREEAYWGRWRGAEEIAAQFADAWRVVTAVETGTGALAGFARAMSDGVATAYLADVFVLAEHRGHGLGKALVELMVDAEPRAGMKWMLHTRDAHALYARFGFAAPDQSYLERPSRR